MRETKFNVSKSKGELNMKRTIVILALVTAFVLAFTAVAQATWRGFSPVRTNQQLQPLAERQALTCADVGCSGFFYGQPCTADHFVAVRNDLAFDPVTGVRLGGLANGFISFPEAQGEMRRNFFTGQAILDARGDFVRAATPAEAAGNVAPPAGTTVGLWTGAFGPNDAGAALQGTAHGGYVTTTTKCIVCHSVHRATGIENPNVIGNINNPGTQHQRNQNQSFLTAGSNSCVECHVVWGSMPSNLLVEWGGPWGNYTDGGPHAGPRRGCMMCHNAGIHGLSSSRFNVMNVFMLGNTRRMQYYETGGYQPNWQTNNPGWTNPSGLNTVRICALGTACPNRISASLACPNNCANRAGQPFFNRDAQIEAEMHLWAGVADSRGNVTIGLPAGPVSGWADLPRQNGNMWWAIGDRIIGPVGGRPGEGTSLGPVLSGAEYGAARSMATAYTCSEAGCHTTGAFFTQNWGVGFDRVNMRRNVGAQPVDGFDARVMVTGHVTPSVRSTTQDISAATGATGTGACGPCHGMNPAGFPTASTQWNQPDLSRRAYGCDQCHDMVGVATNSTAWPHGNRNIMVYEWTADGDQIQTMTRAGNLWMYAGSIARADDAPNVTGTPHGGTALIDSSARFLGPTSDSPWFADSRWFVMTNVGSGRYGVPSNPADVDARNMGTGLVDGSCLKCHVAIDSASMNAAGSVAAEAIRHIWPAGQGGPLNPSWNGIAPTGSARLFLYR